jgi:hypothetical protein
MSQITKLIGYTTITVQGQEIPVKFGMDAFQSFIDHFGIELDQILDKLFKWVEREENGEKVPVIVPVRPFETAQVMLWAGANFVNKFNGGNGFRVIDASNWIDELGGINSPDLAPVWSAFWKAYKNGGTPPIETDEQKKSEVVPES